MFSVFLNSFSIRKHFVLLELIFRLESVFVTKFVCANLAVKTSAAKLLNSGVVIYLSQL